MCARLPIPLFSCSGVPYAGVESRFPMGLGVGGGDGTGSCIASKIQYDESHQISSFLIAPILNLCLLFPIVLAY